MSHLMQPFNPNEVAPDQGGPGGLPVGKHPVVIKSAETKPTKENDGGYIEFVVEIIAGPQQGAQGVMRLNLYNKSETAVRIARGQLSALCHAVGRFQLGQDGTDLSVLYNIPFMVDVQPQKSDPNYTEVKKILDANGNEPGKTGGSGPAQTQGGQAGGAGWHGDRRAHDQGQTQGGQQQGNQGGQQGGWGGNQGQQTQPQQPQGQGGWNQQGQGQQSNQGGNQGGGWNQGQGSGQPSWGPR